MKLTSILKGIVVEAGSPKIQRMVDSINAMIAKAVDEDGEPIAVVDPTSTYEMPYVYQPIVYNNGRLKIVSTDINGKQEVDVINKSNMEFDGIGTLQLIGRMYRKALKQHNIQL